MVRFQCSFSHVLNLKYNIYIMKWDQSVDVGHVYIDSKYTAEVIYWGSAFSNYRWAPSMCICLSSIHHANMCTNHVLVF